MLVRAGNLPWQTTPKLSGGSPSTLFFCNLTDFTAWWGWRLAGESIPCKLGSSALYPLHLVEERRKVTWRRQPCFHPLANIYDTSSHILAVGTSLVAPTPCKGTASQPVDAAGKMRNRVRASVALLSHWTSGFPKGWFPRPSSNANRTYRPKVLRKSQGDYIISPTLMCI